MPSNREQEAVEEMQRTEVTPSVAGAASAVFLLLLVLPSTLHLATQRGPLFESSSQLGGALSGYASTDLWGANRGVLSAIEAVEDEVGANAPLATAIRPTVQTSLLNTFQAGNAVVVPREDNLYFQASLDHLLGPPFHDTNAPLHAIVAFQEDLLSRGIELVLVIPPAKPTVDGFGDLDPGMRNPSWDRFVTALPRYGLPHITIPPRRSQQYLATDTHWTWATMNDTARRTATALHTLGLKKRRPWKTTLDEVAGRGDLFHLLDVAESAWKMDNVPLARPRKRGGKSPPKVLLLGDSFSNIYRDESLYFGKDAGFPEVLAGHLGQPIDAIVLNDGGASATRKALAQDPARLDGIDVVVWEFAARELSLGDWSTIRLPQHSVDPATLGRVVARGETERFQATVRRVAQATAPNQATYPNEIVALELEVDGEPAWAYTWSLKDRKRGRGARLRPGQVVSGEWRAFADAPPAALSGSRSEIDDRPTAAPLLWVSRWSE